MTFDAKEFTEEIDVAITSAENTDGFPEGPVGEVESEDETKSDGPGGEGDEVSDDLPSEDEQGEPAAEVVEDDTDPGDPGTAASEDGADGAVGEAEGDQQKEPAAPAISDAALTAAVQAGLTIEDARSFASDDALLRVVGRMEFVADGLKARIPDAAELDPESAPDPLAALPDLDPEEYDPKVIEMFNGLKTVMESQFKTIESLREAQDAAIGATQEASDREVTQWFDDEINSLGFEETLGQGGHGDHAPGSSQLAKRDAIAGQCAVLMAGYQAAGQPTPSRDEIFRASARLVLVDEYQALRDKELSAGLKKRAGQHISRAGGKKTKSTQSPEAEIAAMLDEKYGG